MADTHLISGLVAKRAETAGELARLKCLSDDLARDLLAIDRVLRSLGYQGVPAQDICPVEKRPAKTYKGSISHDAVDVMRDAGEPMSATDIADKIADGRSLTFQGQSERENFRKHVKEAIRRLRQRGLVEVVGEGAGAMWRLVD